MKSTVKTFGQYRLDVLERELERNGVAVSLGGRSLDILIALVERAPQLVDKRELVARTWPNRFVEESYLRCHVKALRRALGDGQVGCPYVANVHGRGYRFVAPVSQGDLQQDIPDRNRRGSGAAHVSGQTSAQAVTGRRT